MSKTMTPKEKANELVDKFIQTNGNAFFAKECALITVDEILELIDHTPLADEDYAVYLINRWEQIKQELEKL